MIYAFFDVDGTLTRMNTMKSFLEDFYASREKGLAYQQWKKQENVLSLSREDLNRCYYKNYADFFVEEVLAEGRQWFERQATQGGFFCTEVMNRLRWHQRQQHQVVLVSGSFSACLQPIAEYLRVKYVLCTQLTTIDGRYSGEMMDEPVIGEGKVRAIQAFREKSDDVHFYHDYAYGDHESDRYMLSLVGNPVVISGDKILEQQAHQRQWEILSTRK